MDIIKSVNEMLMKFGLVDIVLAIVLLVGLLRGYRKGFGVVFGNLIQIIIITTVTLEYTEAILGSFSVNSDIFSFILRVVIFVVLVGATFYFTNVILQGLAKIFTVRFAELIDKVLGAITGGAFFIITLGLLTQFLLLFPGNWIRESYETYNMSGSMLIQLSPEVHKVSRFIIPEMVRSTKAITPPTAGA